MSRPGTHQSSPIATGDIALSGWGSTAAKSVFTGASDLSGAVQVTAGGAGIAANPTVTLTFKDGAFPQAPFALTTRGGASQPTLQFNVQTTTTQLIMQLIGTPVAAEVYIVHWMIAGGV